MKASFTKLNDGWGVRVIADEPFEDLPQEGSEVLVTKRSGESQTVVLKKQLWAGEDDGRFEDAHKGKPSGLYALA